MAVEWVVGIAILSVVVGYVIGRYVRFGGGAQNRVTELESALSTAQEELADYKSEVFGQFAGTAEKFRALDRSYNELHRQLAQSSVALCGDAATPLLENSGTPTESDEAVSEQSPLDAQSLEAELIIEEPVEAQAEAVEGEDSVPTLTDVDDLKDQASEVEEGERPVDTETEPQKQQNV